MEAGVVTDKGERIVGDVVLAADGPRSLARQRVLNLPDTKVNSGYALYRAYFTLTEEHRRNPLMKEFCDLMRDVTKMWVAKDLHMIIYTWMQGKEIGWVLTHKVCASLLQLLLAGILLCPSPGSLPHLPMTVTGIGLHCLGISIVMRTSPPFQACRFLSSHISSQMHLLGGISHYSIVPSVPSSIADSLTSSPGRPRRRRILVLPRFQIRRPPIPLRSRLRRIPKGSRQIHTRRIPCRLQAGMARPTNDLALTPKTHRRDRRRSPLPPADLRARRIPSNGRRGRGCHLARAGQRRCAPGPASLREDSV